MHGMLFRVLACQVLSHRAEPIVLWRMSHQVSGMRLPHGGHLFRWGSLPCVSVHISGFSLLKPPEHSQNPDFVRRCVVCVCQYNVYSKMFAGSVQLWEAVKAGASI